MRRIQREWQVPGALALALVLILTATVQAASPEGAGVVSAVTGEVTVSRAISSAPQPLRFKDEVFYRDLISTAARSLARLLLGKKALVTVRELSELRLIDQAGISTVQLALGKISIGVARQRMRPGEIVEIRTQNAVAAIRGTVVVAEALTPPGASLPVTRLHVLSGYIDVTTPGNPGAPPLRMVAPSSVTVTGNTMDRPAPLDAIARAALLSDLQPSRPLPTRVLEGLVRGEQARAAGLARIITGDGSGGDELEDVQAQPEDVQAPITPPAPNTPSRGPSSSLPFIFNNESPNITGDLYTVRGGLSQNISTDFLEVTNSAVTVGGNVLDVSGAMSSTTTQPFMSLSGSTLAARGLTLLQNGTLSLTGTLLDAVNSTVNGDLGTVRSNGQLTLSGSFLRAVGGTIGAPDHLLSVFSSGGVTGTGLGAFFDFSGTTVNVGTNSGGQYFQVSGGSSNVTLAGPLLAAAGSAFTLTGSALLDVSTNATFTDTTSQPLWSLNGGSLQLSPAANGFMAQNHGTVSLSGGLLDATNSQITSSADFVLGTGRGQFVVTGPAAPLVSLTGGTHQIATAGSIFRLVGTASARDPVSGLTLGTEDPIRHSGGFLELNAATVSTARAVRVDVALLDASAPLLNLFGGAQLTTSSHTIDLTSKAKVTNTAAFVSMDQSRLTVNHAALVNVAGGSFLRGSGNLVNLANGSTLTINNGVLLFVGGGSIVNISGALIAFSGTPGNTVSISNALGFVNIGGIPVALTNGALASNVVITGTPVKNAHLGTITPNTALIQVSGPASKVTISGN
jgi:FecR protein